MSCVCLGKTKGEAPTNVDNDNPHPHMKPSNDDLSVNMPFSCPRYVLLDYSNAITLLLNSVMENTWNVFYKP